MATVISLVGFATGCDNDKTDNNESTTVAGTTATAEATETTAPTKPSVENASTDAAKKFFEEELLQKNNNGFSDIVYMLNEPEKTRATWLITPQFEDFSKAEYDAVIYPELSDRKYSDVVNEAEFAELKGDGTKASEWFFINGDELNTLFDSVFEKGRFTVNDLLGTNEDDRITSKGFYVYKDEAEYNMYYTYYVNYRHVAHEGDKVILKVNLISAVEVSATPGYVGVCEFDSLRSLGRLTLAENEMPEDFTFDEVADQLYINTDTLNEYTFTFIETADGYRLHSFEK
ncbi:MAG: hypothetical protein J6Q83_05765 [Clostridia bacterium]|nr:hypothetical protein [Clostridia bacterium]